MNYSKKIILLGSLLSIIPSLYAGGGSEYAYIFSSSTQEAIKPGGSVLFHSNGSKTPGISYTSGKSDIVFSQSGNYLITFFVAGTQQNSFGLFLDGVPVDGGTYSSGSTGYSTGDITGQTIVNIKAGSILTLRNHSPILGHGTATVMIGIDSQRRAPVKSTVTSSITILQVG